MDKKQTSDQFSLDVEKYRTVPSQWIWTHPDANQWRTNPVSWWLSRAELLSSASLSETELIADVWKPTGTQARNIQPEPNRPYSSVTGFRRPIGVPLGERGAVMWFSLSPFSRDRVPPVGLGLHIRLCQNAACHPFIRPANRCRPSSPTLSTRRPDCITAIHCSCPQSHWCFYLLGLPLAWSYKSKCTATTQISC